MNKFKNKIRDAATALLLSLSKVENNSIRQPDKSSEPSVSQDVNENSHSLAYALKNNIINQEVRNLRWRTYKVLRESKKYKSKIVGYEQETEDDENLTENKPIVSSRAVIDQSNPLSKIKVDTTDQYPLEMVVNNEEITMGKYDSMIHNGIEATTGSDGKPTYSGNTDSINFFINNSERPISVEREILPRFEIEQYTKRLNVRVINESERLLEFYVSKYPIVEIPTSKLFVSEIKKIIEGKRSDIIDITGVGFITYNTIGADDLLGFQYDNLKFDKIIEYDGYYVIKYKADVVINGIYIADKYLEEELEKLYNERAPRKISV